MQLVADWEGYVVPTDVVTDVHWMVYPEGYFFWDLGTYLDVSQG